MRRIPSDSAIWHVFDRGARRLNLCRDEEDFRTFLAILKESLRKAACELWAFALMMNHYHLLLRGSTRQVTLVLRSLNYRYSRYHNRKYALSGHAFESPYRAYPQKTRITALYKAAYIFLNPVTAGLVSRPEDYRWSGYRSFLGLPDDLGLPVSAEPMRLLGQDPVQARSEFDIVMGREKELVARRKSEGITRRELMRNEWSSLLDHARRQGSRGGFSAEDLALVWGDRAGIPTGILTDSLGLGSRFSTLRRLKELRQAAETQPGFPALSIA
jgi:REP element-mobilizing transposase RayT